MEIWFPVDKGGDEARWVGMRGGEMSISQRLHWRRGGWLHFPCANVHSRVFTPAESQCSGPMHSYVPPTPLDPCACGHTVHNCIYFSHMFLHILTNTHYPHTPACVFVTPMHPQAHLQILVHMHPRIVHTSMQPEPDKGTHRRALRVTCTQANMSTHMHCECEKKPENL